MLIQRELPGAEVLGAVGIGGQAMQRVRILGSMARANSEYSTMPTDLQGKSGSPLRCRADWTRQSRITKTARASESSVTSWTFSRE